MDFTSNNHLYFISKFIILQEFYEDRKLSLFTKLSSRNIAYTAKEILTMAETAAGSNNHIENIKK